MSFVALCLFAAVSGAQADKAAQIYTSVFPPVVTDDMAKPGFAYELVREIFAQAELPFDIEQYPWQRAQTHVRNRPHGLIFPLTRTPTREEKFEWGFTLFKLNTHFITLDGSKLDIETARKKRIGVHGGSSWDNWLTENNFKNIHRLTSEGAPIARMLEAGRIDAWYSAEGIARTVLHDNGLDDDATFSEPILSFDVYIATNKEAPYPHMDLLQDTYRNVLMDGRFDEILTRYKIDASRAKPD